LPTRDLGASRRTFTTRSCRSIGTTLVVALVVVIGSLAPRTAYAADTAAADELMQSGADAFRRGEWGAAERDWRQADVLYTAAGDVGGRLDAWLNLGAVQQQVGKFTLATTTLLAARDLAEKAGRKDKLAGIQNALGVAYTFTRQPKEAEKSLAQALQLAGEQGGGDPAAVASIRNNFGNLYAAWSEVLKDRGEPDLYDKAFDHYAAAADLARQAGDATLAAKASTNAALSAARGGQADKADDLAKRSQQAVGGLPDSLDKAHLLIAIGQTNALLIAAKPADEPRFQRAAFDAYEQAKVVAKQLGNPLAGSYANGYQGRLYENAKRYDEALTLTRRAVLLAQQAQSPDSLYLWQWQTGRIFKAQDKVEEAVASYTGARDTLEAVRSDLALGYGNRGMRATFRAEVGPLYYELADLLLVRADAAGNDDAKVQQYLSDARNTVERLRVGELESYLEDPCVNQAQAERTDLTRDLARIQRGNPAVVYLIPLSDRVEILVTTKSGMTRVKSTGVSAAQLTDEVREFRRRLERRTTHRYLANAKQLYTWLIEPIAPLLQREQIDTLVFVPDGALRTVPMAALHDGDDFLIARYAVAVSPGLSLRLTDDDEFRPEERSRSARVLASGLSEQGADKSFAALPSVESELATIEQLYGGTTLLNEAFKVPSFSRELARPIEEEYSIVHIASHGVFAADVNDTYVLTYDGKLNLASLEQLLRPYQLQGKPIDLLTLSACQTSAGDDQAALERASLGLGGLAVKAGARSALASLWFANDQATGELIAAFYAQLRDNPEAGKAKALQQAQLQLIRGEDFSHPVYWAPFLMIGDWL
jgi:CHAT domain-containing protein